MLVGVGLGAVAGYYGGLIDEILMRVTDVIWAIPTLVLAIASTRAIYYSLTDDRPKKIMEVVYDMFCRED